MISVIGYHIINHEIKLKIGGTENDLDIILVCGQGTA